MDPDDIGACEGGATIDAGGGMLECAVCSAIVPAHRANERTFGFADACARADCQRGDDPEEEAAACGIAAAVDVIAEANAP